MPSVNRVEHALTTPEGERSAFPHVDPGAFASTLDAEVVRHRAATNNGSHVEATATPLSGKEAASAIRTAWRSVMHEEPSESAVSTLVAQWALETGNGRSMMNYNFGGIKGTGPSGLSTSYRTHEGSGASQVAIEDRFRAYKSADEGAADYLKLLSNRYPDAIAHARGGDTVGFVHALKRGGYFTANESDYAHAITSIANRVRDGGLDGIGGSGGAATQRTHAPSVLRPFSDLDLLTRAPESAVDARSFSDELVQAALRIAESGPSESEARRRHDAEADSEVQPKEQR